MYYFIIKKAFNFLLKEYDFKIVSRSYYGFYRGIEYENGTMSIRVDDSYDRINITVCEGKFIDHLFDENVTLYFDEFKCSGTFRKKVIKASKWLRNQLINKNPLF